ncbi:MAG: hypothetical protein ACI9G1_004182 [Pirellulaceae bacterium]
MGVEKDPLDDIKYLSSDDLQGRGIGTDGLNKAAEYIASEFRELGLKTELFDGGPFQMFKMDTTPERGPTENNSLDLIDAQGNRTSLKLDRDFSTLAVGGSGKLEAELVFVGYGISAPKLEYDDYIDMDVKDKIVVMIRKEPQQANPHSSFNGTKSSQHAYFTRKVANAFEHGAAAVIMFNDEHSLEESRLAAIKRRQQLEERIVAATKKLNDAADKKKAEEEIETLKKSVAELVGNESKLNDVLVPFLGAGGGGDRKTPVFFATRKSFESIIKSAADKTLSEIEKEIDKDLKPQSVALGWKAAIQSDVIRRKVDVKNVVAVIEGKGPLADETVVVGAHYDHLGSGGPGSLAPWTREIHNGADDNASGTAGLLHVARAIASQKTPPARRVVFIAFTGEERGLIGSAHYVKHPKFPLNNTVAMINMDMIGRLKDNKLIIQGLDTATEFDALADRLNKTYEFIITKKSGGFGPSDHSSFYSKKIPVMHIFTGTHSDYHRPSDDWDLVNAEGLRKVANLTRDIVTEIIAMPKRPEYKEVKQKEFAGGGGDRPYFGSIPDFAQTGEGYALMDVTKGGPAERAGMKTGDVIIQLAESKIGNLEDFDSALRKHKAGEKVPVKVRRGKETITLHVILDPPR